MGEKGGEAKGNGREGVSPPPKKKKKFGLEPALARAE